MCIYIYVFIFTTFIWYELFVYVSFAKYLGLNLLHMFMMIHLFIYISIGVCQGCLSMCQDSLLYQKHEGNTPFETQVVLSLCLALCCGAWTCRLVLLCFAWKVGVSSSTIYFSWLCFWLVAAVIVCTFHVFRASRRRLSLNTFQKHSGNL